MKIAEIKKLISSSEYDFLRTNEHLGKNIILLTLGGSHAYGTNIETSDVDIRGCALNSKADILTNQNFEQFVNEETDTTIYAFNKLITLLSNVNPNTIEILGCKPEHYLYLSPIGQELLDNKHLFLSKKCVYSFGGYANSQLRRLDNKAVRLVSQSEREVHIRNSIENAAYTFRDKYFTFDEDAIKLYIDKSEQEEYDTEIFMDINLHHYPLRDYSNMWSEMNNIVKEYSKLGKRNSHAI
jgi:predicted nucleotidyltransferase